MRYTEDALVEAVAALGWDVVGTKWAPTLGTRKYNKDAFIVIKNRSRTPFEPSKPNNDQST